MERHAKNKISNFYEYQAYLHKIGLEKQVEVDRKFITKMHSLYDRYQISEDARENVLPH